VRSLYLILSGPSDSSQHQPWTSSKIGSNLVQEIYHNQQKNQWPPAHSPPGNEKVWRKVYLICTKADTRIFVIDSFIHLRIKFELNVFILKDYFSTLFVGERPFCLWYNLTTEQHLKRKCTKPMLLPGGVKYFVLKTWSLHIFSYLKCSVYYCQYHESIRWFSSESKSDVTFRHCSDTLFAILRHSSRSHWVPSDNQTGLFHKMFVPALQGSGRWLIHGEIETHIRS